METNSKKRFGSGAAALVALGLVGLLGFAAPASAAGVDPYNIDPARKGSITLTKYSTPENERTTIEGNGKKDDNKPTPNSKLLPGATFELYKVEGFDLTTNAGWLSLENLIKNVGPHPTKPVLQAANPVTAKGTGTTNASGVINWTNLDLGAYYVVETGVPAGHKAAAPFFVTVPMTDPVATDNWMYDIFVYPKNIEDSTVKIPQDKDTHAPGDQLPWDIRTTIPGTATNPVTVMRFEDELASVLTFQNVQMQIADSWNGAGNIPLTLNTDYTVTHDTGTNKVVATLTPAGLSKLNNNRGKTLIVRINTIVNETFVGTVDNEATVITNKPGSTTETEEITTPGSVSKFGKVTVNKTDSDGKPLSGAEFAVYYSHKAAPDFKITNDAVAGIAKTGVVCKMTAGATSCSDELRFSDFAENEQLSDTDARWNHYWLVETKAPQGYELLTQPIGFEITKDNTTAPSFALPTITVKNVKHGGGLVLPFTGGAGSIAFAITGIALLVGGGAMVFIRSRRTNDAEARVDA